MLNPAELNSSMFNPSMLTKLMFIGATVLASRIPNQHQSRPVPAWVPDSTNAYVAPHQPVGSMFKAHHQPKVGCGYGTIG
jgi:hypothetical protein